MNIAPTAVATPKAATLIQGRRERRALSTSAAMASRIVNPHGAQEVALQVLAVGGQPHRRDAGCHQRYRDVLGRLDGTAVVDDEAVVVGMDGVARHRQRGGGCRVVAGRDRHPSAYPLGQLGWRSAPRAIVRSG